MPEMTTCTCKQCGVGFLYAANQVARGRGQFCSRKCSTAHAQFMRWQVHKRPVAPRPALSITERYERYVVKRDGDACWGWTGFKYRGYGRLSLKEGPAVGAHRISYEMHIGPIPEGLTVLHRCDNPECSNPAHLMLGTNLDNNLDRDQKGRTARGEGNGKSKLNADIVREIRRAAQSETAASIARRIGVGETCVRGVISGRTWGHVHD